VQGRVIVKVTDLITAEINKLFVAECADEQHQANLAISGVTKLPEQEAVELARTYQPAQTRTQLDPSTLKEEHVEVPALDLRKSYEQLP